MASVFTQISRPRENTLGFRLTPTSVAYANTLRRLCMSYVETVGFRADIRDTGATSDVEVLANSTPMTNEMLAHRIGLLPMYIQNPLEWAKEADTYEFLLGAQNDSEENQDVVAGDFKVLQTRGDEQVRVPTELFFKPNSITNQTCLIAILKAKVPGGQPEELRVKAKASLGTGRENARFIPTSQCAYSYTQIASKESLKGKPYTTWPEQVKKHFEDWVIRTKKVPEIGVLEKEAELRGRLEREYMTLEIQRCYVRDEKGEPNSFDFVIESIGVLDPVYIVRRGCEAGAELCRQFVEGLGADVTIQRSKSRLIGWDFYFQKQDHTLGHLLQTWIDANLVDTGEVTFIGYDIPHPLRDELLIRIGVADGTEATARKVIQQAAAACAAMFDGWKAQWDALTAPAAAPSTAKKLLRPIVRPKVTVQKA
jgi:DNA-directed RNA polymerase subunit L/DNA-directed RNA polymerase alpha subunit